MTINKDKTNMHSAFTGLAQGINRRDFLKASSITAAMMMASRVEAMAGPFLAEDFNKVIPADKKLTSSWIDSLYQRGKPLTVDAKSVNYVGMPINGLGTGQVYLSADGQLWYWNLTAKKGNKNNPKGAAYLEPYAVPTDLEEGFALEVNDKVHPLSAQGFSQVQFTNQYPMGKVNYSDNNCPIDVELQAYTPFVPLNRDDSSYPVVIMRYNLTNRSDTTQTASVAGWIKNDKNAKTEDKINRLQSFSEMTSVECLSTKSDSNSIALALVGEPSADFVNLNKTSAGIDGIFKSSAQETQKSIQQAGTKPLYAALGKQISLKPGEQKTVIFAVAWRVPKLRYGTRFGHGDKATAPGEYHYATVFGSAAMAANQVAKKESKLFSLSQNWVDTWYDSSLPYWLLERSFIPIDCMQTQTAQRIYPEGESTDIYNLEEGVRCCPGNCTHVWNYAQGLARIFPQIERECRDRIEYGKGFNEDNGMVYFRYTMRDGAKGKDDALDGTCGTIIRVLRESQMTTDYRFLQSIWPRVKLSMDFVIKEWDPDEDGILAGAQHNTLDEPWHGRVPWLINVYHAALRAAAKMAEQMNEPQVAQRYQQIIAKGVPAMVSQLWREDFGYFVHIPPDDETKMHGSTNGCHIDQVLGESWLHEVGLPPILPNDKTKQALESLYKYNFSPDVGAFRDIMKEGRWYAAPGEAGLVMCSFPNGKVEPKSGNKNYAGYLNECMTGFEWQVAAHMLRLGMVEQGLTIGKAIYDRYAPERRNPYNEVECSDHYSRAMASYSAFLAVCGYQYDGPEASLTLKPILQPENFKAAFTTAEGWGQFRQSANTKQQTVEIELRYGQLELRHLRLGQLKQLDAKGAKVSINGRQFSANMKASDGFYELKFDQPLTVNNGQTLLVELA
ncbi:GH116 family glycosyl hydrolase [Gayadomonas joobiniege]|uniref:GH116 family glycosyl hydrolase n=1 Tax=Gayadomonas joobiniege TaxID=1234606 RepID=UPI0003664C7D|nr:GH116 family glycosyl hydrolase [Gayadomonas joobiniege]